MKKRAALTTAVLAISLAAASFVAAFAGGDPWSLKAGPTITWSDACLKACATPALYNLCQETLLHAPDAAAANVYALAAAERAKASLDATAARAERLLGGGWFPGLQREAYWQCVDDYLDARGGMVGVVAGLVSDCVVEHSGRADYAQAVAGVERCAAALKDFQGSPLVAMNTADHERAVLASELGALILGKQ
ncbi:hypothetical protein SEVIR_6G065600v4 [Setaria viridis]|uniref:Pectinesterase inhibitor domain-containing protein n=1 Tax=Setaria viridis TaxID=4556 RepID=A0A4U6U409_SETVI|nr:hypothetical protein SEVIR_6G065600v2 [Setaria viridis]